MDISDLETNQNVIYVTEEEHRVEWTYDATKELLKIYDEKSDMLDTGIITTQKKLWELTSKALGKSGYFYTAAQCENKWKALKRSYRTKLERVKKFGSYKRSCPFEYEVAEILSKRPSDTISRSYSIKIDELKKQDDDLFNVNLNQPPGFIKNEEPSYAESEDEMDIKLQDESKEDEQLEEDLDRQLERRVGTDETNYVLPQAVIETSVETLLVGELSEIRNIIGKHYKMSHQILKQSTDIQEKLTKSVDESVKMQKKILEVEEKKMMHQNEMIRQMKIQNSLLQKLMDKL